MLINVCITRLARTLTLTSLLIIACDEDMAREGEACVSSQDCEDELACVEDRCAASDLGLAASDISTGTTAGSASHGDTICTTETGITDDSTTSGGDHVGTSATDGHDDSASDPLANCVGVPTVHRRSNPFDRSMPEVVAAGKISYDSSCAACHGVQAEGNAAIGGTPLNDADAARAPDCFYLWKIMDGSGGSMPPFSQSLNETEIWQVVTYLRSLQP